MRIGMMLDMYKPYISGVTNHVETYTKMFIDQGHEVKIFTFGNPLINPQENYVIYTKGFPINVPFADLTFNFNINHPKQVIKMIQSMDIINIHHPFLSGNLAYRYCKNKKIPIVFTSHTRYDLYTEIYTPFLPQKVVRFFVKYLLQKACNKFDMVITPSSSSRKMYDDLKINANFKWIPNGIRFPSSETKDELINREKLGIHKNDFVFIFVGRLGPEKNLPILIDAFSGLIKHRKKVKLLLVGKGTEQEKIINQINRLEMKPYVILTGYVEYENIFCYLNLADAFFSLSNTEVHPLSVLEAMSVGLPTVGLDVSGINDVIENNKSGLLSSLNLEEIIDNLIYLVDHPEESKALGKYAKDVVVLYNVERTSKLVIETFQKLIAEKKA